MRLRIIITAIVLLSTIKIGFSRISVYSGETRKNIFSESVIRQDMTQETLRILLEDYAAPEWGLSPGLAWEYYHQQLIVIVEHIPDVEYTISFDGHDLDVLLEHN